MQVLLGIFVPVLLAGAWILHVEGHFHQTRQIATSGEADAIALTHFASWKDVSIRASDGAALGGWLFTPREGNSRAVLLVHGGNGSRRQMLRRAGALLDSGYTCLIVDQRGCGTSAGRVTMGAREPRDMVDWTRWLRKATGAATVYAQGSSRGATTLLQSLALQPELDGLVAECASVGRIREPYQIVGSHLGISEWSASMVFWPLIESAFAWVRWRHGWNPRAVRSSVDAVRRSSVPILLVHGTADETNPYAGAEMLRAANPSHVALWPIRGGKHDFFNRHSREIMAGVVAWFDTTAEHWAH